MSEDTHTPPWKGEETIMIAFDLGTTQSAVSYSHLQTGRKPAIKLVTRWPGQVDIQGDSKIPTIIAYQGNEAKFFGEEALEYKDNPEYKIASWFKLQFHPASMKTSDSRPLSAPPLPVDATTAYTDFMRYAFENTRKFFIEREIDGDNTWNRLRARVIFVFAIPNAWDMTPQSYLRTAAIRARLVEEKSADHRIHFVTEGEASVHFILRHINSQSWLQPASLFVVTDAGGSTVDSTLYKCKSVEPDLILEEVTASECIQAGGIYVDDEARDLFVRKLKGSRYYTEDYVKDLVDAFEQRSKRVFDGSQKGQIKFGGRGDNDPKFNILQGILTVSKDNMTSIFDDVIKRIVMSCSKLLKGRKVEHLILVGGLGESPYLRKKLGDKLMKYHKTKVVVVNEPKKAAAEGAAIWFTHQLVESRVARTTFGVRRSLIYDETNPEHRKRESQKYIGANGCPLLPHSFQKLVKKGDVITEDFQTKLSAYRSYKDKPKLLGKFHDEIYTWESEEEGGWVKDLDGALYPQVYSRCLVMADLSGLVSSLSIRQGMNGHQYWHVDFDIVVTYNGTQLRAKIQWKEDDSTKTGPAALVADFSDQTLRHEYPQVEQ
ncbi:hypothetical protein CPB86DRAFT_315495 [Serendipita vermifera]|nr:hypothetical protein CPB86DRAFT_315495 [Serendipita vermifera]